MKVIKKKRHIDVNKNSIRLSDTSPRAISDKDTDSRRRLFKLSSRSRLH